MNISYIINILGEEGNEEINPVTPPIYQTSKFYFKTVEQFRNAISADILSNVKSGDHIVCVDYKPNDTRSTRYRGCVSFGAVVSKNKRI